MKILIDGRTMLEAAGFATRSPSATSDRFYFEDSLLIGAVIEHVTVESMIRRWEQEQDSFLGECSPVLQTSPLKAWNIYTVHLTPTALSPDQSSKLFEIEEDFRGTRKIARAGVQTKEALQSALLPILPIQTAVALSHENLSDRLSQRLSAVDAAFVHLLGTLTDNEVAQHFAEGQW